MPSKVRFMEDCSPPEELEKLRRFAPVFEHFAAVWNVNIYVDASYGKGVPYERLDDNTVYVHMFGFSKEGEESSSRRPLSFVFGVPLFYPRPENWEGSGTGNLQGIYPRPGTREDVKTVVSPEGVVVAQVYSSHLYILLDFSDRMFPEDSMVLRCVLAKSFPIICAKDMRQEALSREFLLKDKFHQKLAARSLKLQEVFREFSRKAIISRLCAMEEAQADLVCSLERRSKSLMQDGLEILETETNLQAEEFSASEEVDEEFDALLSWPAVKGIRIKGNMLAVYTSPLTMEKAGGKRFLIGEYLITIDLDHPYSSDPSHWVQVAEHGWRGPYRRSGLQGPAPMTPSWGTVIRQSLPRALKGYNFSDALQDVLFYLTAESAGGVGNPSPEKLAEKPPEPAPFYASEADKRA